MRPLIGITCSRVVGGAWGLYSPGHFMDYTFDAYSRVIQHCGGAPVLIPAAQNRDTLETILGRLDGILLSGGPDVNPKFYGEQPSVGLGDTDEGLDLLEYRESRKTSLCCEGGGGRMFYEAETAYERNSEKRVQEAVNKGADVLTTSCPFCVMTLEDPATEKELPVKGLSEIIIEVL